MSKLIKNFVGIDISKLFFDAALLKAGEPVTVIHARFDQSFKGFAAFREWMKNQGVLLNNETLVCMEHTGIYNTSLVSYLYGEKALVWVEMAIRIKKSEGFTRSANDKTDAIKIAWYAFRHQDKKQLWSPADQCLVQVKHLIAQRDRIIDSISKLTVPVNELAETGCVEEAKQMKKLQHAAIKNLELAQKKIEDEILKMVSQNKSLADKVNRVKSIKGIGTVTAIAFLVYTNGFTLFDNGKQLACYCGVVPFVKKESGKTVKSKPRVSPFANKKLKRLLHLCALSAIRYDNEIRSYYQRKAESGKNKMSVINAVRNKLVLRMYAVIRDDRDFVENYKRNCA